MKDKYSWEEAVRIAKEMRAACKTSEDKFQLAKYLDSLDDWRDIIARHHYGD